MQSDMNALCDMDSDCILTSILCVHHTASQCTITRDMCAICHGFPLPYSKSPENRSMHRIGIIASIPYCTAGVVGLMYLIPTGVVLLLAYGVEYVIAKGGESPELSGSQAVKEGTQLITDIHDDLNSDEIE